MIELLSDPAAWASFATLTILEIVLGVDNVIFISIVANRLPARNRGKARIIGLTGALGLRIALLASISWVAGLTYPVFSVLGHALSWRDLLLLIGGLFLLYKASGEIYAEVEGRHDGFVGGCGAAFGATILQIMALDLVFSFDSVITAVGIADHLSVMIAAVVVSILVMMAAAGAVAAFIERHPSTKMLALAFLAMVGMVLLADGLGEHIERGFVYAAVAFGGGVETLNLLRANKRRRSSPANCALLKEAPHES